MLCRNIKQNIEKKSQEMTFNSLDKKGVSEVLTFGQDLNEVGITVCTDPRTPGEMSVCRANETYKVPQKLRQHVHGSLWKNLGLALSKTEEEREKLREQQEPVTQVLRL